MMRSKTARKVINYARCARFSTNSSQAPPQSGIKPPQENVKPPAGPATTGPSPATPSPSSPTAAATPPAPSTAPSTASPSGAAGTSKASPAPPPPPPPGQPTTPTANPGPSGPPRSPAPLQAVPPKSESKGTNYFPFLIAPALGYYVYDRYNTNGLEQLPEAVKADLEWLQSSISIQIWPEQMKPAPVIPAWKKDVQDEGFHTGAAATEPEAIAAALEVVEVADAAAAPGATSAPASPEAAPNAAEQAPESAPKDEPTTVVTDSVTDSLPQQIMQEALAAVDLTGSVSGAALNDPMLAAAPEALHQQTPVVPTELPPAGAVEVEQKAAAPLPHLKTLSAGSAPLGISLDLSPSGLVSAAISKGCGAGDNWQGYQLQHRQAAADSALFAEALQQATQHHEHEMDKLRAELAMVQGSVEEVKKLVKQQAAKFKAMLKEQMNMAEEVRANEVRRGVLQTELKAAETWNKERLETSQQLDKLREELNVLSSAFAQRSGDVDVSAQVHRITLTILALEKDLAQGRPFSRSLMLLQRAAGEDPLLQDLVASLPKQLATEGLPSTEQLISQFRKMRGTLSELSYFPEGSGGYLAHTVAKLAAALKINESGVTACLGAENGTVDGVLGVTEDALVRGDLTTAVQSLEKALQGTAAGKLAQGWCDQVRRRALVDQALALMRAHAASQAASIVV